MADPCKVRELEHSLGVSWPNLESARTLTLARRDQMEAALEEFPSADVSIVVYGSLARAELTQGSDPDWSLLIDGAADPNHFETARAIKDLLVPLFKKTPGAEQTFGTLSFSHELVHLIGGQDDTNKNTTRRILLLLESVPIGRSDAYDRVINCVLNRYLLEDRTFAQRKSPHHVPRFLYNDIARYWRTMAVDFAYKAKTRHGSGMALRNFKLRMSRKLIYVSGMLSCFACELKIAQNDQSEECAFQEQECVSCLRRFMCRPPLEVLADVLLRIGPDAADPAREIMGAYDDFIGVLADDDMRSRLELLTPNDIDTSSAFGQPREISHRFRDGLQRVFFDLPKIARLTRIYGVF